MIVACSGNGVQLAKRVGFQAEDDPVEWGSS
jgi:hypothetical protein